MNITANRLTAAAGLCAVAAGAIFIGVQVNHPPMDSFLTDTDEWVVRCSAKAVMSALALAGITGIYLRQVRQMRLLGLVGYLLFAAAYLMLWATEVMAVTILPALKHTAPGFARDVVIAAGGGKPTVDIGDLQTLFIATGACYVLGGLVLGIALFRAGILARWAAILLAVSTVATAALAVLPEGFDRPLALPEGVALIGLGVSLWRDQRRQAETADASAMVRAVEPATR